MKRGKRAIQSGNPLPPYLLKMKLIGITGGIGSGKTHVSKLYADRVLHPDSYDACKASIFNTDDVASEILKMRSTAAEVKRKFGEDSYIKLPYEDREIYNKEKFRRILFSPTKDGENSRRIMRQILHKKVLNRLERWQTENAGYRFGLVESALFFQYNLECVTDYVISVVAPKPLRLIRLANRGVPPEIASDVMSIQLSDEEMIARSDYVILNGENDNVLEQITLIHDMITSEE